MMANPNTSPAVRMRQQQPTPATSDCAGGAAAAGQGPVSAILTCTRCALTYEPSGADLAAGRTECPDPDCGGWTFWAQLRRPNDDRSVTAELEGRRVR